MSFFPVQYEHDVQECNFRDLCRIVSESLVSQAEGLDVDGASALSNAHAYVLSKEFLFCAPFIKHVGFREENEWRLAIVFHEEPDEVQFRLGEAGLLPYLTIPSNSTIRSVIIGPRNEQQQSLRCLQLLLRKSNDEIALRASSIPFR